MTDKKQILKIIDDEIKIYEEKLMIVDTAAYSKRQISIAITTLHRLQHKINEQLIGGKEMEKQIIFTEKELIRMLRGDSVKLIDGDMKTRFYMEDCDEPEPQKTPNELRELFGLSQI